MTSDPIDLDALQKTLEDLSAYVSESEAGKVPVLQNLPLPTLRETLKLDELIGSEGQPPEVLRGFLQNYLQHTTRLYHPNYIAHQVALPNWSSALASLVNGMTNNGLAVYEMGPAGVAVEQTVVHWLLRQLDWQGSGLITHGGSLANLTCLLGARAAAAPEAWQKGVDPNLVVLVPEVSHYSVARSIAIMGLGSNAVQSIPVDHKGRIRVEELSPLVEKLKSQGKKIMAIVANACATAAGMYDPLEDVGRFCRENQIWFHVDGAHGASAVLSPKYRSLLRGLEFADSMIWDMHKMLETSALCAAALFRSPQSIKTLFSQKASYLSEDDDENQLDPFRYSIECTKGPVALKFYMTLLARGEKGLAAHVEDLYNRAREFHELIDSKKDFSSPFAPESNILLFQYLGKDSRQLPDQNRIHEKLMADSEFYITSTQFLNQSYLRLTVMNPKTDRDVIEKLLEKIRQLSAS